MKQEEWREYPLNPKYYVSSFGNIKTRRGLLKQMTDKRGYKRITLRVNGENKSGLVHRMVTLTFIGCSDLTVDHIDGVKSNNMLENLRYMDRIENAKTGRNMWHINRALKPSDLERQLAVITFASAGRSSEEVSVMFNVKKHNIQSWVNKFQKAGVIPFKKRGKHATEV